MRGEVVVGTLETRGRGSDSVGREDGGDICTVSLEDMDRIFVEYSG